MLSKEKLFERIVIDPKIMAGKPVIKGTRLPVQQILRLLAQGISMEEVMQDYDINKEDILACLLYATEALGNTVVLPIPAI